MNEKTTTANKTLKIIDVILLWIILIGMIFIYIDGQHISKEYITVEVCQGRPLINAINLTPLTKEVKKDDNTIRMDKEQST